ncbi:MAG TPA: alpha/beta hydrolase [Rhodocyclaceae bacterium]|jgi:acetyl esterase/lipase|nr:alpha/beta hydrolase [Rhodocyclaceae bacterium]
MPTITRFFALCVLLLPNVMVNVAHADMFDMLGTLDVNRTQNHPTQTIAYGNDPAQNFDAYVIDKTPLHDAPVIFMVHGGGWRRGDKASSGVVDNKLARWGGTGFLFISTNYRMLPMADPYMQAEDVARALAAAQRNAAQWGADPKRFVLMGHSAGAHLVALLAASPGMLEKYGALPPLAVVSLDSATLDVVQSMSSRHFRLYDDAFGSDPTFWAKVSPWHALQAKPVPFLAVCSTRRADSCPQAQHFIDKITSLGGVGQVLGENLSHGEINQTLGEAGAYTDAVESFLKRSDPTLAERLQARRP